MNITTIDDLKDKTCLPPKEVCLIIEEERLVSAQFLACNFAAKAGDVDIYQSNKEAENVFLLFLEYKGACDKNELGYLSQVHLTVPKTFKTPQAVMSNAKKLGLTRYYVDSELWEESHYNVYKKQAENLRAKRNK